MAKELGYVLINPHTIAKSRTGGVIARYIGRTDLSLAGARMFGPSQELVDRYADMVRTADPAHPDDCALISEYIRKRYCPDPLTGKPRRVMLLLFEGEDAVQKIWQITGSATSRTGGGETIRDTYGDYVLNEAGGVQYFEPAVLVAPTPARAAATLRLWAQYSGTCGGIVAHATDVEHGEAVQKTLVMLKPDNFRFPSLRPGNIIDILSGSGLRIVAVKKIMMTVAQAEQFYGPVREVLSARFGDIGGKRVADALTRELGFEVPLEAATELCRRLGPLYANSQFDAIVEFMTGFKPSACPEGEKATRGCEGSLALVYEGVGAVGKIRSILGATDPSKAKPGSVRREFGSNIMVNAAHASDSTENAVREMKILRVDEDNVVPIISTYYPPLA